MLIGMNITEELKKHIAEAAARLQSEKVDSTPVNDSGLILVVKNSPSHKIREGRTQYLGEFKNGGEFLLFAG